MIAPVRISDHVPAAPDKQLNKVELYNGPRVLNGNDVPLLDDILTGSYQEIRVYGAFTYPSTGEYSGVLVITPEELISNYRHEIIDRVEQGSSSSFAIVYIDGALSTGTSLRVSANNSFFTAAGVYKVVGYKKRYATENNSRTIAVNGGNNITVNSRYPVQLPPEFYDGSTGLVKAGVSVRAEVYITGTNYTGWAEAETGHIYNSSNGQHYNYGVKALILGTEIVVDAGGYGNSAVANKYILYPQQSNPWGIVSSVLSAPCRVVATLNDKTAISVPVGDKGYGGLRKDTVDTTAIADFTVPNAIDFNLPLVSSPLKVTQNVSNNRLSLSQIGIWGSSGSINLTFDSGNNGREIIADIYNETKGQVALEKPEYVARNQLGITIPISVDVLEILTSGDEYSLRVRSNDVFTNVKVGKCWWDVTLNAPL